MIQTLVVDDDYRVGDLHCDYVGGRAGQEVLRRLGKGTHPAVDVISAPAAREVEILRAAMRGGVVHYLIKPFLFATFEEKLRSYAAARDRMVRLAQAEQLDVDPIF